MSFIRWIAVLTLALAGPPAAAQTAAEHMALGIQANIERDPKTALGHFETAIALEPTNYEANWRAAQALVDLGKLTPDSVKSAERDSLYARAEGIARVAVEADPDGPDGHYILSAAIGRASLTKSKKERVRRAAVIRSEALRAIELDPNQDKAYHVMGRWHAEIMRLSGLTRFFAKTFLGAAIFNEASWQGAIDNMEKAVALAPENIYHHLDLAEIYIDRDRYSDARKQLEQVESLPVVDVQDPDHKETARILLKLIEGKKDKT